LKVLFGCEQILGPESRERAAVNNYLQTDSAANKQALQFFAAALRLWIAANQAQ
jgi:hypothetical protein